MKNSRQLIEVANGSRPAGLVLKNANVVNVFTGEILPADVAIEDGYIAGVGQYSGREERDCTDLYLAPGFVDAHMHIESTMALPAELVRTVLPWGTTTIVADPHEIVNVCGARGMQYMLNASEGLPCNIFYMLPSSVPSTPFETAGADFTAADMQPFLNDPRVLGLGEVMCFTDVIAGEGAIMEKIAAMGHRPMDGHAPGVTAGALQAYVAAGISSEHECTTFAEALEKARAGLAVLVREGSAAHNLSTLVNGLVDSGIPTDRFMFCTDDKHLDDIGREGTVRWCVKLAIDIGMKPVDAIRMASWNAARHFGLQDTGAVAAGYKADLVLLKSLKRVEIEDVYKDGVPAARRLAAPQPPVKVVPEIFSSVKAPHVTAASFALPAAEKGYAIEMVPYQLATLCCETPLPADEAGCFAPGDGLVKLAVVERHGKTGAVQVAALKGYGLKGGAIATTVAHDSHNIIAAGDCDADLALAVNRLGEIGGGYVLVKDGALVGEVPLTVAGLMSAEPYAAIADNIRSIVAAAHEMGVPYYFDPFISLSFLALPVIPELRLTDKGLFHVNTGKMLN